MSAPFDEFASHYDKALQQGLAVSGEDRSFFARGRVEFLVRCLSELGERPRAILDFGCGDGETSLLLHRRFDGPDVLGVDIAPRVIDDARRAHAGTPLRFLQFPELVPDGRFSLVYTNGVFHHIPPPERPGAIRLLHDCLRPGGLLALWDNNPWSLPGRYVMKRIPFDRDAVLLWPGQARRLLREDGFRPLRTDYQFIFPRFLKWLRFLEPPLSPLPFGAQYQVLARRP